MKTTQPNQRPAKWRPHKTSHFMLLVLLVLVILFVVFYFFLRNPAH